MAKPKTHVSVYLSRLATLMADKFEFIQWVGEHDGRKSRLRLRCLVDGNEWEASLDKLLCGRGCPKCKAATASMTFSKSPEYYEEKIASVICGMFRFDGWAEDFHGSRTRARLCCLKCENEWSPTTSHVINGRGCPECAKAANSERFSFSDDMHIKRITGVADGRYRPLAFVDGESGYSGKVSCVCNECSTVWSATVCNLVRGTGCPLCSDGGYSPSKPGTLYAMKSECGSMVKVGISNKPDQRLKELRKATPFKFRRVAMVHHDNGALIAQLEKDLHARMTRVDFGGVKFQGYTEWMEWDPALIGWLQEFEQSAA